MLQVEHYYVKNNQIFYWGRGDCNSSCSTEVVDYNVLDTHLAVFSLRDKRESELLIMR